MCTVSMDTRYMVRLTVGAQERIMMRSSTFQMSKREVNPGLKSDQVVCARGD